MEKRSSTLVRFVGYFVILGAIIMVRAEFNPIAALIDPRPAALVFSSSALLLFSFRSMRSSETRRSDAVALVTSFAILAFALYLTFFIYETREVKFASGEIQLAGTLYLPRGAREVPGIIFIHGSGPEPRTEFRWHAKHYARNGIASLTYDKRGAGKSGGGTWETDYEGYARDAAAAVRFLRNTPEVASECVGILGHSEGGWVAPIVASTMKQQPAFVIVTATTHLSPAEQVLYETGSMMSGAGHEPSVVDRAVALQRRVLSWQRTGAPDPTLSDELKRATGEPWFGVSKLPAAIYPIEDYEWWRSVMDFDAVPHWSEVAAPVLAIAGGRDLKSDARANDAAIRGALAQGRNPTYRFQLYPSAEHGMIEWWLPGRMPPPRYPDGFADLLVDFVRTSTSCR